MHVLITTSKIFWEDEISHKEKIQIYLNNGEFVKTLTLDEDRKIYINKKLDISIIELKKDDGIGCFYELDNSLLRYISDKNKNIFHICKEYNNESIYSMNYKNIKNVFCSFGLINNFTVKDIKSSFSTDKIICGGPIALLYNNNIIGINNEMRIPLIEPIIEFQNIENNLMIINKEDIKDKLKKKNIIIDKNRPLNEMEIEYNIKKNDKQIKIFGEVFIKNNKDKAKLIIDNKEQELTDIIKIENKKKNLKSLKIKLKEIKPINNMSYMFDNSKRLTSLNVSKWDTTYVDDMSYMFNICESLTKLPDISI